jgi:hypothetical protein
MEILKFCEKYLEKLATDRDITERPLDGFSDYRDRITFRVCFRTHAPVCHTLYLGNSSIDTITLDSEDLEYLFQKYFNKLDEEKQTEIKKIQDKYDSIKKQ